MGDSHDAMPAVVRHADSEKLWFLGTLTHVKLDGRTTGDRLGVFESLLPHGASPCTIRSPPMTPE